MGRRGPKKNEQPDSKHDYYWVPQDHLGGKEMVVPRLMKHSTANKKGYRRVETEKDRPVHKPVAQDRLIEPMEEDINRMHKHKLTDEAKSYVKHPVSEIHGQDRDLSEHLDELAKYENKKYGPPEEKQQPWFEKLGVKAKFETLLPLQGGRFVAADEFTHPKLGNMYIIDISPGVFLFHAPQYKLTEKFNRRELATRFAEKFVTDKLGEDVTQKAFDFIDKANILHKAEELQQAVHASYKSGNNTIELSGDNGTYIVKANNEEILSTNDLEAALRRYYQQVENLSGQKTEDSDISLDIFGDKVVQMNREALAKLASLGEEDTKQKLLAKMNRLIKYEAPVAVAHGVQEYEDVNQGTQETGNKPSKLESKAKYIQADAQKGYRESEVENKEPFFKEKIYVPDENSVPKGYQVTKGPRGGLYYDTENKASGAPSGGENVASSSNPTKAKKEKITKDLARKIGDSLKIDFEKIDFSQFYVGVNVELEHGTIDPETNVTNDNLLLTGKISWIHIKEVPDYYTKLETYVDPEYAHLLSNKISKEEGMTPYIPEDFAGSKEIEQPKKVAPSYKNREEKQDPILFDNSMDGDEPEFYFKSEDIYDFLDQDYFSKMGVKYDPNQVLPYGARTIGKDIEKNLYDKLRKTIDNWYMTLTERSALDVAKMDLKTNLLKWQVDANIAVSNDLKTLFEKGISAGVRQSGVQVDQKAIEDITQQLNKPIGVVPALEHFQNQLYGKLSHELFKNYDMQNQVLSIQKAYDAITDIMIDARYKTQLMIKSEVASLSHYGMLKAWDQDPENNNYRYYWKSVIDKRTKPISLVRKQGNPYTFNEITFLWKNQEQLINGKWMNDKFFQRCGIARGKFKLDYNWKKNRFLGKEMDFKETI